MASAAGSVPAPVAAAARRQQRATSALHLSHGGPAANASPLRCLFMLALLCVLAPNARGANPTATHIIPMFVSSVSPAEGSIFGGSRLFVNGSGFETNHHVGGNVVKVGRKVSFRNVPRTLPNTTLHPVAAAPQLPLHNQLSRPPMRTRHPVARSMPARTLAFIQSRLPRMGEAVSAPFRIKGTEGGVPLELGERGTREYATGCLPSLPFLPYFPFIPTLITNTRTQPRDGALSEDALSLKLWSSYYST